MLVSSHSAASFHTYRDEEDETEDAFQEVIVSCRSLSHYEDRSSIRTAIPQAIASLIAASFHIVIGIALAFSAILIPQIENDADSPFKLSKSEGSLIASIFVIFIPVGCMMSGAIMEVLGRVNTIKLAAIPCIIGWSTIALANNFYALLIGRILTGLGCAFGTSPAIVYITEVSRPDLRGSLMSCCPTIASFGMIIAYAEGAFMHWRLVAWVNIVYTLVPVILVQFVVPESPAWLVSKGRIEDAAKSLGYLYKAYPQPEHTHQTLAEMHLCALQRERETKLANEAKSKPTDNETEKKNSPSKLRGFLKPTGYKPMIILFWLFLIQQFSGIYITLFFAVTFFQEVDESIDAFKVSILVGFTRFAMSLTNAWLLKRYKRRHLIMTSSLGMAACMFVCGASTLWLKQGVTDLTWVPIVFFMLYVCSSMIGLLSIPWTMTAEMFPMEIRGIGHSIAYSMANVLMFLAIQSYRSLTDWLGGSYAIQWFFAVISVIGFFFGLLILPETHGKKLSEIEAYFKGDDKKKKNRAEEAKNASIKVNPHLVSKMSRPVLDTVEEQEYMIKPKHQQTA